MRISQQDPCQYLAQDLGKHRQHDSGSLRKASVSAVPPCVPPRAKMASRTCRPRSGFAAWANSGQHSEAGQPAAMGSGSTDSRAVVSSSTMANLPAATCAHFRQHFWRTLRFANPDVETQWLSFQSSEQLRVLRVAATALFLYCVWAFLDENHQHSDYIDGFVMNLRTGIVAFSSFLSLLFTCTEAGGAKTARGFILRERAALANLLLLAFASQASYWHVKVITTGRPALVSSTLESCARGDEAEACKALLHAQNHVRRHARPYNFGRPPAHTRPRATRSDSGCSWCRSL